MQEAVISLRAVGTKKRVGVGGIQNLGEEALQSLDPNLGGTWSLVLEKFGGKTPQLVNQLLKGDSLTGADTSGI